MTRSCATWSAAEAARAVICFLVAMLMAGGAALTAAEPSGQITMMVANQEPQAVIAALRRLTGTDHDLDPADLRAGRFRNPISLALINASAPHVRQSVAHALGCWWSATPTGGTLYSTSPILTTDPPQVRTRTSGLVDRRDLADLISELMAPWTGTPGCGISYQADRGLWSATLDGAGQARLVDLLGQLERREATAPSAIPVVPPLEATLTRPIVAVGWPDLAGQLAEQLHIPISCGPDLGKAPSSLRIEPGLLTALDRQLDALGIRATEVRGVWCWGLQRPRVGEHPAQSRRIALLPTNHLLPDPASAGLLLAAIRREVVPGRWADPGWGLAWLGQEQMLLIAADPPTIHAVWDLLDRIDLLGLDAALSLENIRR